jgi:hypothetical protein
MKKQIIVIAIIVTTFLATTAFVTNQQNVKSEASEHPRIEKAINSIEDAIAYMEKAPHDFGGHKVAAIADSKKAVASLKLALAYRAGADSKKK